MWALWSKIYFIGNNFENFMKRGPKGEILILVEKGPLGATFNAVVVVGVVSLFFIQIAHGSNC